MIESANEFQIVKNVINVSRGLRRTMNWYKVQQVLLNGTTHAGKTSSINKAIELGVDPYSLKWEKWEKGSSRKEVLNSGKE